MIGRNSLATRVVGGGLLATASYGHGPLAQADTVQVALGDVVSVETLAFVVDHR